MRSLETRAGRRTAIGLAGGLGITAIAGGVVAAESQSQSQAITTEGQMASLSSSALVFDGRAETQVNSVSNIRIESRREAADRFGADAYSSNPKHWKINAAGGATLKPDSTGLVHRVRTHGAVWEGWLGVDRSGDANDAVVMVANPRDVSRLDLRGGTAWLFRPGDRQEGWNQVRKQVKAKEKVQQPGVIVMPVCEPDPEEHRSVTPDPIASAQAAAERYGADPYSRNPDHWFINQYGGATLEPDPRGLVHRVNTSNSVWEGWLGVDRSGDAIDALSIVSVAGIPNLDIRGGTVWDPRQGDKRALFFQVLEQVKAKEAQEQPGVLVLPVCN